jgi:CRP-like cAMP-binding protein
VALQAVPRQNRLLAALPPADFQRLLPDLEPVTLQAGLKIHESGGREDYLYFLTSGLVSRIYVTESGASTEFALTGSEGFIGVALFLGGGSTVSEAVVLSTAHAHRLGLSRMKHEIERNGPLARLLLRYTQALIAQTGQIAACNRHHRLEQQLCRWILSCLDRLRSNELAMTHELIASLLGVRREGITEAAGRLQEAGLIHYHRGHIAVLDRGALEDHVCECYGAIKHEYDRLFPEARHRHAHAVC